MSDQKFIALVVIDMQKGLFKKAIFKEMELLDNINKLIDYFHDKNMKIYFIRHTNKNILMENSDDWQLHSDLHLQDSDVFINKEHSSAFKGNTLKDELNKTGIENIVIVGLVTHGCVKAACQDANKLGYGVTLIEDAHSSFNKDAESYIVEWNKKLEQEGINVIKTNEFLEMGGI